MNWRDEVANGLPEPRDDEPESLRQNIVDELADHLSCALVRELHFTPDEKNAIQRVLDRFGDPRKIARRLWLDSMKEKLMSQRIALATSILAAAASIAACAMVYFVVNESRAAIQTLVEQRSDKDQAILDRLEQLASRPAASASPEWNPAKLRLVQEKEGGSPAVGYVVSLTRSDGTEIIEEISDSAGVVDFGLLAPGQYNLTIWTPGKEEWVHANYSVRAGRPADMELVCASPGSARNNVTIRIDWPNDLRDKGFRAHGFFRGTGRSAAGRYWVPVRSPFQHLVLANDGIIDLTGQKQQGSFSLVAQELDSKIQNTFSDQASVLWQGGNYVLAGLEFFGPLHRLRESDEMKRFGVSYTDKETSYWGGYQYRGFENADISQIANYGGGFGGGGFDGGGAGGFGGGGGGFFSVSDSPRAMLLQSSPVLQFGGGRVVQIIAPPSFEVKSGVENVWKISLPEAVTDSIREQLADPNSAPSSIEPKPSEPKPEGAPQ